MKKRKQEIYTRHLKKPYSLNDESIFLCHFVPLIYSISELHLALFRVKTTKTYMARKYYIVPTLTVSAHVNIRIKMYMKRVVKILHDFCQFLQEWYMYHSLEKKQSFINVLLILIVCSIIHLSLFG